MREEETPHDAYWLAAEERVRQVLANQELLRWAGTGMQLVQPPSSMWLRVRDYLPLSPKYNIKKHLL